MSDEPCNLCGQTDGHSWVEGDCVLEHRNHSRRLVENTHVCQPCVERWDTWLAETVDLYAGLSTVTGLNSVPSVSSEGRSATRSGSPAQMRLTAWALLYGRLNASTRDKYDGFQSGYLGSNLPDIPAVLAAWAQACTDHLGWNDTAPDTVSGATALLRGNLTRWASSPDVDTFDTELRWIRRSLHAAHGIDAQQPVGRCPSQNGWGKECGGPLWPDRFGAMAVTCGHCNRHFDDTFLRHLGGMLTA